MEDLALVVPSFRDFASFSPWLQLVPLLFSMYSSPEFEATVGKVRAGHLRRQLSHWDQDSRHELHLHEEVTAVTLRYWVCSIHPEPSM